MQYNSLTRKINTYFAVLFITIAGAGASMIIMRVAYAPVTSAVVVKANVDAIRLQRSILGK